MERATAVTTVLAMLLASPTLAGCELVSDLTTGPGPGCPKVTVEGVLHVDPTDPRQVWATDIATGGVFALRPRPDLGWTVDPSANPGRLVDSQGRLASFEGEIFRQACFDTATNTFFIGPEDVPDPNRPPN